MDKKTSPLINEVKNPSKSIFKSRENVISSKNNLIQSEENSTQKKIQNDKYSSNSKKRKREPDTLPPSLMWIFNVQ